MPKARAFTGGPRHLPALRRLGDPSLRLKTGYAREDAVEQGLRLTAHHSSLMADNSPLDASRLLKKRSPH